MLPTEIKYLLPGIIPLEQYAVILRLQIDLSGKSKCSLPKASEQK